MDEGEDWEDVGRGKPISRGRGGGTFFIFWGRGNFFDILRCQRQSFDGGFNISLTTDVNTVV